VSRVRRSPPLEVALPAIDEIRAQAPQLPDARAEELPLLAPLVASAPPLSRLGRDLEAPPMPDADALASLSAAAERLSTEVLGGEQGPAVTRMMKAVRELLTMRADVDRKRRAEVRS